ncbi:MAG TPA: FtsX-like permease family protein [Gemmatimonadales bacterium]|nr:FtsX-like permease family protein [Gemmatimonadales bacterium]
MSALAFVARLVGRELRAEPRKLALLTASVTAGVAALVAINSFTVNLQDSVARQARALLGADLVVTSRTPFSPRVEALIDSVAARRTGCSIASPCGATARVTDFPAMGYVPRTTGSRLVQVSAIEGAYPFYGEIKTEPASAWRTLQDGQHAVVDPALLTSLGARVGDTLALGDGRFIVTGTVVNLAGDVGVSAAFGPRVFIPARYLDRMRVLGTGSRAEHSIFVKLSPGLPAQAVAARWRPVLRPDRARVRTVADDRADLNDTLTRLARYLGLVAVIALLLGGVGVASAVVAFVRRKLEAIAVLRCLGATSRQVFAAYLTQAVVLGLVGSLVGALLGVAAQQALPGVLRGLLPVDVRAEPVPGAMLLGVGAGVWTAVVFALLPLLPVRLVSPLAALRRPYDGAPVPPDLWRWPAALALAASVVALAALEVGSWRTGAIFAAAVGVALGVLWLAAWLLTRAVRRWFPASWPYVWRQGLANLHRPANQTVAVVLALGFGAFLLSTLFLVQHNLLRGLALTGGPARPNLVLIDIQRDQLPAVKQELRARGLDAAPPVPIVPMRILSVRGSETGDAARTRRPRGDTRDARGEAPRDDGWARRREYRSTYRDTLVASERIVAGHWWSNAGSTAALPAAAPVSAALPDTAVAISVERELAGELGVGVGDEIVWDVQGVPIRSRVASLREVNWARFEPNFFVVFAPGALEAAPQSFVLLTRAADAVARGRVQRAVAERFANVTVIDLSLVQQTIERLVNRVTLAIRFMALFSLATGALVLAGAIATGRLHRVREAVLLRTLGATRRQVLRIALAEYLALGLLASVTAVALSAGAAWGLARWFFDGGFRLPLPALAGLVAAIVALTVAMGLWSSRSALRQTPLAALRDES